MGNEPVLALLMMMCFMTMMVIGCLLFLIIKKRRKPSTVTTTNTSSTAASPSLSLSDTEGLASDSLKWGPNKGAAGSLAGNAIITTFTFENNTPANANTSASSKPLVPFVSVALPFKFMKEKGGGPFSYGDWLYLKFLDGKRVGIGASAKTHTGWVRLDTYCGDSNRYDYCIKDYNGKKYTKIDLYIGPFKKSGQKCMGDGSTTGPAGKGEEFTEVKYGPPPTGKGVESYGIPAKGPGKCNDVVAACVAQSGLTRQACAAAIRSGGSGGFMLPDGHPVKNACYWYIPQYNDQALGWCSSAVGSSGSGAPNGGL